VPRNRRNPARGAPRPLGGAGAGRVGLASPPTAGSRHRSARRSHRRSGVLPMAASSWSSPARDVRARRSLAVKWHCRNVGMHGR
jgi:hypothetical protein